MDSMCLKFETNDYDLNRTFRIALGELYGNIYPYKAGLLDKEVPVILAGLGYDTPWTRDASINTWNCGGLLYPEASKNTLLSVLEERNGKTQIGGQYWDCIIWTIGAWHLYLYTGDKDFLKLSLDAVTNSLKYFEETEFSKDLNLFRGPACYGDGISAYPDIYAKMDWCGIDRFPQLHPELANKVGYGNPMHSLSTNCLYYHAYILAGFMCAELGSIPDMTWEIKAKALKDAVNKHFWMEEKGFYRYLVDPFGGCDHQEGLGHSFVIMFGIADKEQAERIFQNQYVSYAGIPCVWPAFDRYISNYVKSYGRHSGTIWPHIQVFWAEAATMYGKEDIFSHEFQKLKEFALRDSSFYEIYHPDTGEVYGGLQEGLKQNSYPWLSSKCQTWCATGFIHMVLMNIIGMKFEKDGIRFVPMMVKDLEHIELKYLKYRNMMLSVFIEGRGKKVVEFKINNKLSETCFINADASGEQEIYIKVTE